MALRLAFQKRQHSDGSHRDGESHADGGNRADGSGEMEKFHRHARAGCFWWLVKWWWLSGVGLVHDDLPLFVSGSL